MKGPLDLDHLARIERVLAALGDAPSAAHAALVLEDAYMAVTLGVQLGLTPPQILKQAVFLVAEIRKS
jgi:hypothetical protein